MALKTVAQLKDSVAGILSGIDLSNVDNLNGALERAIRVQIQKADIPEASGIQNITLYNGVFNYACAPEIFGTEIKDIRPQGISRLPDDYVYKKPSEQFDRTKGFLPNGTMTTFEYYNGLPIIRIVSKIPLPKAVIDPMNAVGNWVASGTASSLVQDTAVFYQSPASLRFTLGSGTGILTETLSNTQNLSSYQGVGMVFLAIEIPANSTAADLTSIALKLGSSSSNYSSVTATQGFLGAWVSNNWLQTTITANTDTIILNDPAYSIYEYESSLSVLQQTGGGLGDATSSQISTILNGARARNGQVLNLGLYDLYRGKNPTESLNTTGNYYEDGGYGGGYGY